jgi:uncharacterized protein YbjT (DUF2867 family)
MSETVLVTGATGSVGRYVVDSLLREGRSVRALSRRPEDAGLDRAVDVRAGELEDPASVVAALGGVRLLYLFPAGDLETIAALARDAGVEHVVLLSSASVAYGEPDASSRRHQAAEEAIRRSGLSHTFVRPGAFMSNDLVWAAEIRSSGTVSTAYPDGATAPVDVRDVAGAVVAALLRRDLIGAVLHISGPESLSQRRRVELLALATGGPITLVELTPEQAQRQMSQYLPADAVELILGVLAQAPAAAPTNPVSTAILGRPAGSYLDWARAHRAEFTA